MSLASDLMGLGVAPLQAMKTSSGGVGPLTIVPAGTTYGSSTKIGCSQYLVTVQTGANGSAIGLPPVGGDNGAYLADDFIINNQMGSANSLLVIASTSVLISLNGSLSSIQRVQAHTSATFYAVQTNQTVATGSTSLAVWIGVGGT
jgi:hypothetical protein